jgi:hypothetical protein
MYLVLAGYIKNIEFNLQSLLAASRSPKDLKKPRDLFMLMFVLLLKL